jgi:hypothetical protein
MRIEQIADKIADAISRVEPGKMRYDLWLMDDLETFRIVLENDPPVKDILDEQAQKCHYLGYLTWGEVRNGLKSSRWSSLVQRVVWILKL